MAEQSNKEQQQAIKATLKAIDEDYKNKVREAEKKCANLRKEAEKVAEREKAVIKAKKDKADKEAKDELQLVKKEAVEVHIKLVIDLVKNVILDIKSRNLEQSYASGGAGVGVGSSSLSHGTLEQSNSTVSSPVANGTTSTSAVSALFNGSAGTSAVSSLFSGGASSASTSSASKEDAEIKEWVDYAAERLDIHMSKNQVRQKLLEEVAIGAIIRQHQAQQEAMRRTEELEKQIQQLQLLHQQHLQRQGGGGGGDLSQGQEILPPTYASINKDDYSFFDSKDKKEES
ncbi:MAG: hypothetical protein J3Q66DRAFT_403809 [Benniella sp.]|nr:MAG: hypothetical protein J3Q66DRAFT_403809 [Benniella sp.]